MLTFALIIMHQLAITYPQYAATNNTAHGLFMFQALPIKNKTTNNQ